ncbi:SulP family inorganic anion transporter [Persicimonas caeni]|nr:SulP family inorganic anion transporter [Persicimonas caeni]
MDVLAGMTVALALIPEAVAFSIIAGVDPMVGLYASFCIAVTTAFVGGRPGMISAATGAMALLMVTLVANHGLEYLLAATILTGVLQIIFGLLKVGRFITFIPHPVILGFVNALAILIFMAQLPQFEGAGWMMYAMVAGTLAIIYGLPRITKAVPSALVAIVVMTAIAIFGGLGLNTVGDMGEMTAALPFFHLPNIELSWHTLKIIFPYSFALSMVGMLESLLTAKIVDDMTDTKSDKNKEIRGQGLANIVAGCFGGMAGCAMIGQSVINVKSGGSGRLSALVAGVFLLFLILVLGDIVAQIPMAALVGVMIMVSIGTFDWQSIRELHKVPASDALVMVTTVGVVVYTHDLAMGVVVGVALSALFFGWKVAQLHADQQLQEDGSKHYTVHGPMFFGTATHFADVFDINDDPEHVVIDFSRSHVWDHSAVTAIARIIEKYGELEKQVSLVGLNTESEQLIDRIGLASPSGH